MNQSTPLKKVLEGKEGLSKLLLVLTIIGAIAVILLAPFYLLLGLKLMGLPVKINLLSYFGVWIVYLTSRIPHLFKKKGNESKEEPGATGHEGGIV
jgi:hypothetical protein